MTDEWLDRWMPKRLPTTLLAARRWATRTGRADDDFVYEITTPKMGWRETVAWLRDCAAKAETRAPDVVPIEYSDPKAQAAFEAVYRNRLFMLRVEGRTR